jgi:hypothetical protein
MPNTYKVRLHSYCMVRTSVFLAIRLTKGIAYRTGQAENRDCCLGLFGLKDSHDQAVC